MAFYGITDTGLKRKNNQDYFKTATIGNAEIAVLCDGMGGAAGGAVASKLAADNFMEYIDKNAELLNNPDDIKQLLLDAGQFAHKSVYDCAGEYTELDGMGTTLVACIFISGILHIINAGDSRLYVLKGGQLQKLTKDHSLVQELIDKGKITTEEAKNHPYKNYIMRALGTEETLLYDYFIYTEEFEYVLLCSDGLYNFVSEDDIKEIISDKDKIENKLEKLIKTANDGGGGDNISAVLIAGLRSENGKEISL